MRKIGTVAFGAVLSFALACAGEVEYAFRERLECVHRPDVRNPSARPEADEFCVKDGLVIVLPRDASAFIYRAARDFEDYLSVSMRVDAFVSRNGGNAPGQRLEVSLDPTLAERRYRIETAADGIKVAARDERALAQAFYHLEDLMNLRRAPFLKVGVETRTARFKTRMTHSGYRLSEFPDAHLNAMAHAGMTSIMIFLKGIDQPDGQKYQDLKALIRRAKSYGLDTWLYSCIPTFIHPDEGDAKFDETYGRIAGHYPEAKGIILVGESCQFPSKDPRVQPRSWRNRDRSDKRPLAGWFPCRDYADWVKAVQRAIHRRAPGMKLVFWTYNWGWAPVEDRLKLIDTLPKDVILQATFEMFEKCRKRNGLECPVADYSLSFIGPGRYFASEAAEARRLGLALHTQANAGGRTWDFGTVPYLPVPYQWKKRWDALVKANADWNLSGIMENHHYGWWPSFIAELEKEAYTEGGIPFDRHLRLIAARDFGEDNVEGALEAWRLWSGAMDDYVPTDANQYGPFRNGPAYPYAAGRGKVDASDFPISRDSRSGIAYIRMDYLTENFVPQLSAERMDANYMLQEIDLLKGMEAAFEGGAARFAAMKSPAAAECANMGRYLASVVRTAMNVKRGAIAQLAKDEDGILAAARDEYANATKAIGLVENDSRLGWEPCMGYVGGRDQIRWKLRLMERLYGKDKLK